MTRARSRIPPSKVEPAPPDPVFVEMAIELWPIDRPKPWPDNVKDHDAEAVASLASTIKRVGFRVAIVVGDDGFIAKGHKSWLAARRLGLGRVPVHVARGVPIEVLRVWRIEDNKRGEESGWNLAALGHEFAWMKEVGLDPTMTGFDEEEVRKILGDEPAAIEPVSVPPLPTMTWALIGIPTVRYGEVAQLIESCAAIPDAFVEVTANDHEIEVPDA